MSSIAYGQKAHMRIPGEYEPVAAVLVSEDTLMHGPPGVELVKAVLRAGAEVWVALNEDPPPDGVISKFQIHGIPESNVSKIKSFPMPHGSFWLRDHGPVPAVGNWSGKDSLIFVDFIFDSPYWAVDDFPVRLGRKLGIAVHSYPVELDGGNLLVADGTCLIGAMGPLDHFRKTTSMGRTIGSGQAARQALLDSIGCRDLMVIPNAIHEHIDMWVKPISRSAVFVNQLDPISLAKVPHGSLRWEQLQEVAASLELAATQLSQRFTVHRLPMPLPERDILRTFTNGLLVNGTAILPAYGAGKDPDPDLERIQHEAVRAFEEAGFSVSLVDAEPFIVNGGALHCVTVQIPRI